MFENCQTTVHRVCEYQWGTSAEVTPTRDSLRFADPLKSNWFEGEAWPPLPFPSVGVGPGGGEGAVEVQENRCGLHGFHQFRRGRGREGRRGFA